MDLEVHIIAPFETDNDLCFVNANGLLKTLCVLENAVCKKPTAHEKYYRNNSNLPHDPASRRPTMTASAYKNSLITKKVPVCDRWEFVFRLVLSKWKRKT